MATSKLSFDEGTDVNVATNTISEDAVTKHINRTVLNTSAGVEVTPLEDGGDVVVTGSALPTGASTSANQTTIIGHIDGVETLLGTIDADTSNISTKIDTVAGAVSGTEMQVDVVAALPAGTNAIGKLAANSGVDIGDVDVTSISAGTNSIGGVFTRPETTGGLSIFRSIDLDESEEEVKGSAGQVYGYFLTNLSSAALYIKFYNDTAANVTVGSTTPVITIPLEADQAANVNFTHGLAFSAGITVAATTGLADADTGAPGANECVVNIYYK